MSNAKHTPGPWQSMAIAGDETDYVTISVKANDGELAICDAMGGAYDFPSVEESEANCRLIASAPDLLEAVEALLDGEYLHAIHRDDDASMSVVCEYQKQARAAIAKAKGEA